MRVKTGELCRIVASGPAPRFYVSVREALIQYAKFKKLGNLDFRRKNSVQMYTDLFAIYEDLLNQYGRSAFQYSLMARAVGSTAPSFYMDDSTALDFYYRAMRNKRKNSRR